jgi:hypothetical protein
LLLIGEKLLFMGELFIILLVGEKALPGRLLSLFVGESMKTGEKLFD